MPPQRPPRRGNQPARGPQNNKSSRPPGRKSSAPRPKTSASRPGAPSHDRPRPAKARQSAPKGRQAQVAGSDRLQKILAHAGIGSRRACEELIVQGRITVDGEVVRELGTKVDPARMSVALDGQKIQMEKPVYFAVFKPKGYVSTNNDPSGRPRVLDILPEIPQRVYTVGRLDEMSVGLMILTNDGELANKLAHPRFGVEKLYRVIVAGMPTREVLKQLTDGIWLAEGKVRAKSVRAVARKGEATILEMVLAEGKNREVRRMLAKLGHKVMMLTRVAVGPITIKGLTAGQFRPLTGREVDLLRRVAAGEPVPMPWMTDRRPQRPLPDRPRRGADDGPRGEARPGPVAGRFGGQGPAPRPGDGPMRPRPEATGRPGPGHRRDSPQGMPPRNSDGPRPGPGGPPRRAEGPGGRPRPDHDGPRAGRPPQGAGRPGPMPGRPGFGDRPEQSRGMPPRNFDGPRPGPGGPARRFDDGPRNANGPRPGPGGPPRRFDDGPRDDRGPRPGPGHGGPPRRFDENRGPGPGHGDPPRRFDENRGPGPGRPRPMAGGPPRPQGRGNDRPSNGRPPGDDRRPGPRPPMPARRPPGPTPGDQPRRKVIGMEGESRPAPVPTPEQAPARDGRPAPRMKRPPARRPGPGIKPRRRPGGPSD